MKLNCPYPQCSLVHYVSPKNGSIVSSGSFFRHSDSRRIKRYFCKRCGHSFSRATNHPAFRQKKRRINPLLKELICSGVSQRRAAKILKVNPKTVVRHFRYLASQARLEQERFLKQYKKNPLPLIQFDDLETSEHTKCKPLSVSLAIDPVFRKILSFQVSPMPAPGVTG